MLMLNKLNLDPSLSKDKKIELLYDEALKTSHRIFIHRFDDNKLKNYRYDVSIASNELGIDEELIWELINDYISQIFNTKYQFDNLLSNIRELRDIDREVKMMELSNLAHKNLGVAKNLRIEDAKIILNDLMVVKDIDHLEDCVLALEACAYKLNPSHGFSVLQLMEIKNSF